MNSPSVLGSHVAGLLFLILFLRLFSLIFFLIFAYKVYGQGRLLRARCFFLGGLTSAYDIVSLASLLCFRVSLWRCGSSFLFLYIALCELLLGCFRVCLEMFNILIALANCRKLAIF
jgi:hypothetical protein